VCAAVSNDADQVRAAIKKHFASGGKAAFTEKQLLVRFDQFFAESEELVQQVATSLQASDWPAFKGASVALFA
jgi:hypothetical protein